MSASRELQRQLKRLELCLPRSAKKPPAGLAQAVEDLGWSPDDPPPEEFWEIVELD